MTKVGVLGARGRMGREVVRVVTEAADLEVTAEVDEGDKLDALTGCDVVVDFTHPGVVLDNLRWCAEHDLDVNVKAEQEIEVILSHLEYQNHLLIELMQKVNVNVGALVEAQDPG